MSDIADNKFCVPWIDCGYAIFDFENQLLAIGGRRYFLTARKLALMSLLFISEGEIVTKQTIARVLGIADGKYPHHVIARLVRELRRKLATAPRAFLITMEGAGYRLRGIDTERRT